MPDSAIAPGDVVAGKYRVEAVLGAGGMGYVLGARHMTLDERVAIKVLHPHAAQDEEAVARFVREARAASRTKGEHVVRVIDVGALEDATPYIVMEHLDGCDLRCTLPCGGAFTPVTAPEGFPSHIAVSGSGVYWSVILPSPGIRGKEGSSGAKTVAAQAPVYEILATPDEVYFLELGQGPRVAPRDGGAIRRLRTASTESENFTMTKDDIYFTEPSRGTIIQCARSGCGDGGVVIAKGLYEPRGIAADDNAIYWADEGNADAGGAIFRLAR